MGQVQTCIAALVGAAMVAAWGEALAAGGGLKTFVEKRCYTCHTIASHTADVEKEKAAFMKATGVEAAAGEEGEEKDAAGADLSGVGKQRNAEWLKKFLQDPKGDFKDDPDCQRAAKKKDRKKFKGSPEELDALVAYLAGLKGEAKQPAGFKSCLKE